MKNVFVCLLLAFQSLLSLAAERSHESNSIGSDLELEHTVARLSIDPMIKSEGDGEDKGNGQLAKFTKRKDTANFPRFQITEDPWGKALSYLTLDELYKAMLVDRGSLAVGKKVLGDINYRRIHTAGPLAHWALQKAGNARSYQKFTAKRMASDLFKIASDEGTSFDARIVVINSYFEERLKNGLQDILAKKLESYKDCSDSLILLGQWQVWANVHASIKDQLGFSTGDRIPAEAIRALRENLAGRIGSEEENKVCSQIEHQIETQMRPNNSIKPQAAQLMSKQVKTPGSFSELLSLKANMAPVIHFALSFNYIASLTVDLGEIMRPIGEEYEIGSMGDDERSALLNFHKGLKEALFVGGQLPKDKTFSHHAFSQMEIVLGLNKKD